MAVSERTMDCSPVEVFDVLLDSYLYKYWVVGSKDIRDVDDSWPSVGSAFYHCVGAPGADIKDKSEVLELDVPHRIVLRAYARPLGVARVTISARPSGDKTIVAISEEPEKGTRMRVLTRLIDPVVFMRNVESLRRLERVIEIRNSTKSRSPVGSSKR